MKEFTSEEIERFIEEKRNELTLKGTQKRLSVPIINRLCRKMTVGIRFPNIKVVDGVICDGHHRYIASLLAGRAINSDPHELNSNVEITEWESVFFENEDWDTDWQVETFDRTDAQYSKISLENLRGLLKSNN